MKDLKLNKFFINEHLTDEAIALFADALALDTIDTLPDLLKNHVDECTQCKKEIIAVYEIIKQDNTIKNIKAHPFFVNIDHSKGQNLKIRKLYLIKIAAIFVLLLGLGIVVYLFVRSENFLKDETHLSIITKKQNEQVITTESSIKYNTLEKSDKNVSDDKNKLVLNLKKSDLFETLIESHYRSDYLEVLVPTIAQKFLLNGSIKFKFKGEVSSPLIIMIYDNEEKKVFEKDSLTLNSYTFKTQLSSGLYYWKLITNDDLIFVGKFIIE
jgi:hypothetical protein